MACENTFRFKFVCRFKKKGESIHDCFNRSLAVLQQLGPKKVMNIFAKRALRLSQPLLNCPYSSLYLNSHSRALSSLSMSHNSTLSSTPSTLFLPRILTNCSFSTRTRARINPLRSFSARVATPTRRIVVLKPLRPCISINEQARDYFVALIKHINPEGGGILIQFVHSTSGQPRMVFSMSFMNEDDLAREEGEVGGEKVELEEVRMSLFPGLAAQLCWLMLTLVPPRHAPSSP